MTQTTQFKVAAVQMAPVQNDTDATIDKVVGYIREAADAGAKVIGFPEAIIPDGRPHPGHGFVLRAV